MRVQISPRPGVPSPLRGTAIFVALAMAAGSTIAFTLATPKSATVSDYLSRSSIAGRQLRVGVFADQPLLGERGPDGTLTGFDIDLASALARSIGVQPAFVALDPSERVTALVEGRVDVVVAGLIMTEERQRVIEFAGPYLEGGLVVASRTRWPSRAKGQRLCVVPGSIAEATLEKTGSVLVRRPSTRGCVGDAVAGHLDAVAGDEIMLRGHAHTSSGVLKIYPLSTPEVTQRYGIGVVPGDPFLKALVNSFLLASHARGRDGAWQKAADHTLGVGGFTRRQPRPAGVLLREANDGQTTTGGVVGMPPAIAPASPLARRPRSLTHRRRRRQPRRTVRLRAAPAPGRSVPVDPPLRPRTAGENGPLSAGVWSLLLGVPVAVSALYLWIQSGGDRQFTLMLAESVNPINFLATVSLSVVWIFSAVPALVFTVGAVVLSSTADRAELRRLCDTYAVARWTARTPGWVVWASIVAAAVSTPLAFGPAWVLALCVARQPAVTGRRVSGTRPLRVFAVLAITVASVGIAVSALARGEHALAVTAGWPAVLLWAGVDAPLRPGHVPAFLRASGALGGLLALGVVYAVVTTPILPSTAIQVARPTVPGATPGPTPSPGVVDPDAAATAPPMRQLRGYVVSVDEEATTVLSDAGGVEIVPNDQVASRVSCPSFTDLPGDSAALFGLPLRESLLKALAREQRPTTLQDPRCVVRVDAATG
ncbi:hypothetical protein DKT68_29370 [Micromonospora acroterricola]|uniref:Solute-binding protein family 3/N-terminal domain-containing protein n=1 Tax=Micromonospora acroterricola TaxID=2202421 RepID=A0A317CU05_9ACTN|nr:transporter substrate-binding domain-containing protein [Micromonospora acroterricola]PWR04976.1 hypothetical protein DKT68_29370 [Micromonospora acroterricola]